MTTRSKIVLTDEDLREIFALFSIPTDYERQQVYDEGGLHYYRREDLSSEYSLTQEKQEFAEDAWRAVTYFLHRKGFVLTKEGTEYDLAASSGCAGEAKR
jgi:hypothetical protein